MFIHFRLNWGRFIVGFTTLFNNYFSNFSDFSEFQGSMRPAMPGHGALGPSQPFHPAAGAPFVLLRPTFFPVARDGEAKRTRQHNSSYTWPTPLGIHLYLYLYTMMCVCACTYVCISTFQSLDHTRHWSLHFDVMFDMAGNQDGFVSKWGTPKYISSWPSLSTSFGDRNDKRADLNQTIYK